MGAATLIPVTDRRKILSQMVVMMELRGLVKGREQSPHQVMGLVKIRRRERDQVQGLR